MKKIQSIFQKHSDLLDILIVLIISVPSFVSLLHSGYFTMHDDQHISRLFLLDKGIHQGDFFPRWVDTLGFGFGYPLYNFYPPLIYYIGEIFHLLGFSFIWSVKLTFITGFIVSAIGMYMFARAVTNRISAILASALYLFFFYHAVTAYVRGALAEFFSMAVLPFVFYAIHKSAKNPSIKTSLLLGITLAFLVLNHPLIAFPAVFFVGFFFLYHLLTSEKKLLFFKYFLIGSILGLGLSSFFWLPSLAEKKVTLVDAILTKELASYKIHYIYPSQFIYSPWGYGGSIAGPFDGMTFQLGKIHIALVAIAFIMSLLYLIIKRKFNTKIHYFYFFVFLLAFSLWMTTAYSSVLWDNISFLWYLQFPWRFLTFAAVFISVVGAYGLYLFSSIIRNKLINVCIGLLICVATVGIYHKYFQPQRFFEATDAQLTSYDEIAWRVSKTSFEFVPKGVKTKLTDIKTTTMDIEKKDLPHSIYVAKSGNPKITVTENKMREKILQVQSGEGAIIQMNTYDFPGWKAFIDNRQTQINDQNKYKLITVQIPKGEHIVRISFTNTPIRTIANIISIISFVIFMLLLLYRTKENNFN